MSRVLLQDAFAARRHHLSPFLVLGDPTPEISLIVAREAAARGATMLELGIAYDDPCADGPAIQAADRRARDAGMTTGRSLQLLAEMRRALPDVPFNLLVYGNLVHARGYGPFCRDAVQGGASSLLVPDIPLEECGPLRDACQAEGLGTVQLVAPLTDDARLRRLDAASNAFVYLAANQAVTGKETSRQESRADLVRRVVPEIERPLCLGFGLSKRGHIEEAFRAGARLTVVGSHLARAIESAWQPEKPDAERVRAAFVAAWEPLRASTEMQSEV